MKMQGFTWEYLNSLFRYNRSTGEISRRVPRGQWPAGTIVGTVDGKGYLHVGLDKKFIRLHRLAWFLTKKETPKEIDHRDNDKQNNRFRNLRPCDRKGSSGNSSRQRNNTSGLRGVSRSTASGQWHAQIKIDGKQTYLGRSHDPVVAARMYDKAARKHFGKFAKLNHA